MKNNRLEKYNSMGSSHITSHFRNNDSALSTTTITLLAVATLLALFPSSFALLVPPPFIPQLQHRRVCKLWIILLSPSTDLEKGEIISNLIFFIIIAYLQPFPIVSNPIHHLNSLGDLSIPFGYRQSRPVSITDNLTILVDQYSCGARGNGPSEPALIT